MDSKIALFSEQFGRRIKNTVEDSEKISASFPADNQTRLLIGHTSPVEITDEWTLDNETWKCRAKRLFRIDGTYQSLEDNVEFDLYHPTSTEQPSQGIGARVFALFRGVWEMVSGTSSTGAPRKARLVQPKELFAACEYKTLQDVYGCALEYSDDNDDWTEA